MSGLVKAARVAALLAFAGIGLLARGAIAETVWIHPDRDPFQGTLDDALDLFAARGIPRPVLNEQRRLYLSGRCTRRRIGDGERIALMTFGRNRVLPAVVAAARLWPDWAPRGATVCLAQAVPGSDSEYALLRPDVCGNWSEEKLPVQPAAPAAPAALGAAGMIAGLPPEAGWVSGIADGSGEFLTPVGFFLPAILPDVPGDGPGDSPAGPSAPGLPDSPAPPTPPDSPGSPPHDVPEPGSGFLLGSALALLALAGRAFRPQ